MNKDAPSGGGFGAIEKLSDGGVLGMAFHVSTEGGGPEKQG
jgi:hypothetical protein